MRSFLRIFVLLAATVGACGMNPELPDQSDLRPEFDRYGLIPKKQGARDVCSLCAITGLAEFEWSRAVKPTRLSEEFLIWAASESTGKDHEQAMFYEAIHGLCVEGICNEGVMPYQPAPDANRRPTREALAEAQARTGWNVLWIKGWDVRTGLSPEQLTDVKRQLASGHPVAMGARWPKHEKLTSDMVLETPPESEVFDGHSILFVGYKDDPAQPGGGTLLFRNHRGSAWADHGYAGMSYRYASLYVNDAVALRVRETGMKPIRFEAEALKIVSATGCRAAAQDMSPWGARLWSGGRQLFCQAVKGACLEAEFSVLEKGLVRLELEATFAPDYGLIQVSVDGKPLGSKLDLYSGRVHSSGAIELGVLALDRGAHSMAFKVVGKNDGSSGYAIGLDAIQLTPVVAASRSTPASQP